MVILILIAFLLGYLGHWYLEVFLRIRYRKRLRYCLTRYCHTKVSSEFKFRYWCDLLYIRGIEPEAGAKIVRKTMRLYLDDKMIPDYDAILERVWAQEIK